MKSLKKHYQKIVAAILLMGAVVLSNVAVPVFAAGSGTLSLTPSSSSVSVGSNFTVVVYEDSGADAVNAVQVGLTYPSSVLQFVSLDYSSSAFGTQAQSTAGSGSVVMARGATSPVSGSQVVGAITFKAIAAGTGSVNFQCIYNATSCPSGNAVVRSSDNTNILTSQQNGSYAVAAPSSGSGSSSGSSGGTSASSSPTSTSSSPAASPSKTGSTSTAPAASPPAPAAATPKISSIAVSIVNDSTVNITWQTDVPSSSVVNYGTSSKYELMAQVAGLTTQHSVNLTAPNIVKGATYYFNVVSVSASGIVSTSPGQNFSTPGFVVTILVVDKHGKPIKNATVTLNQSVKTSSSGQAVFQNVQAGNQVVTIESGGKQTKHTIQVGKFDPTTKGYQKQQFSLTANTANTPWVIYVVLALVVLVCLAVMLFGPFLGKGTGGPLGRLPGLHADPTMFNAGSPSPIIMQPDGSSANTVAPSYPTASSPASPPNNVAPGGGVHAAPEAQVPGSVFSPQGH